ncbi:MAG: ribosomal-processing cysteine protease Prp [Acidaminococcus sp.]|jgi:uncharacterized protein YsxB (DUF464 family)|nr:ribosomal-processing cysteine protease Prp [Acidaminococcus sp.]MCI2100413.1 ribosomal-processing cysteine protease Prp [Acidaminococcus sp.]MCI2114734.1 ribosomal-processing cysteine protease Prp [Acidaminococcus sp.]MCI2116788.1 ribosomal-processing cysteine protease Prp [Acidaminococcus sp.]
MIQVDLYYNKHGRIRRYTVSGHADANPEGFDEVCYAVSLNTQIAANGLNEVLHRQVKYSINEEDGSLSVALVGEPDAKTDAVLKTMVCGLRHLQKTYTEEYLRIHEHRR